MQTNGYKLDKNHIFMVSMFDDFEKYAKVPEEYASPEKKPYVPRVCSSSSISPPYWAYHHRALEIGLQSNDQTACSYSWLDTCFNETFAAMQPNCAELSFGIGWHLQGW